LAHRVRGMPPCTSLRKAARFGLRACAAVYGTCGRSDEGVAGTERPLSRFCGNDLKKTRRRGVRGKRGGILARRRLGGRPAVKSAPHGGAPALSASENVKPPLKVGASENLDPPRETEGTAGPDWEKIGARWRRHPRLDRWACPYGCGWFSRSAIECDRSCHHTPWRFASVVVRRPGVRGNPDAVLSSREATALARGARSTFRVASGAPADPPWVRSVGRERLDSQGRENLSRRLAELASLSNDDGYRGTGRRGRIVRSKPE